MAPWISKYWTGFLRFIGFAGDSERPNLGAIVLLVGIGLLAMGFKPEQLSGWVENSEGIIKAAVEFATKMDNVLGIGLAAAGLRMMQPAKPNA